jgi:hypothetical protein
MHQNILVLHHDVKLVGGDGEGVGNAVIGDPADEHAS